MLKLLFRFTLIFCLIPIIPGVLGMLLPAISWQPTQGFLPINVNAFVQLFEWPSISSALISTLISGIGSTLLAIVFCFLLLKQYYATPSWRKIEHFLSPILALPHVAFAIGLVYLLAPTGWIIRLFNQLGLNTQEWLSLANDPYGIALMLCLALKEIPFLLLMSIGVLSQINAQQFLKVSNTLGYRNSQAWRKVIAPNWLVKMRLPIFSIAAYGLSVVDVALIIGPNNPGSFAVLVWQWFNDGDTQFISLAAAGAICLLLLTAAILSLFQIILWGAFNRFNAWIYSGAKQRALTQKRILKATKKRKSPSLWPFSLWIILPLVIIVVLLLWSFAKRWRFPDILPSRFSAQYWLQELMPLLDISLTSIYFALASSAVALVMAIVCLEYRQKYHKSIPIWLVVIPLIAPQISLLFGIQVSSYLFDGQWFWQWVLASHIWFVFPYMYLSLDGAWQGYDTRFDQTARSLGLTAWQTWWKIKRVQLMPSILLGVAVGCSVSLAQYLPTQILGGGRITTITTEAVALSSGQDRRVTALYALIQGVLPLIIFFTVLLTSRIKLNKNNIQVENA